MTHTELLSEDLGHTGGLRVGCCLPEVMTPALTARPQPDRRIRESPWGLHVLPESRSRRLQTHTQALSRALCPALERPGAPQPRSLHACHACGQSPSLGTAWALPCRSSQPSHAGSKVEAARPRDPPCRHPRPHPSQRPPGRDSRVTTRLGRPTASVLKRWLRPLLEASHSAGRPRATRGVCTGEDRRASEPRATGQPSYGLTAACSDPR